MNEAFLDELRALGPALLDEPLHRHNTFGIGGPAEVYREPIRQAKEKSRRSGTSPTVPLIRDRSPRARRTVPALGSVESSPASG